MDPSPGRRDRLIELARAIQYAQGRGQDHARELAELQAGVPHPNVIDLFECIDPAEYLVDYALAWRAEWPKLSPAEMVVLIERIVKAEGTAVELRLMVDQFKANCARPEGPG